VINIILTGVLCIPIKMLCGPSLLVIFNMGKFPEVYNPTSTIYFSFFNFSIFGGCPKLDQTLVKVDIWQLLE